MKRRGFTLIELVITLAICTAIFSGSLPLIYKSVTANRKAELRLKAYESAHQELENVRGKPIANLENSDFSPTGVPGAIGHILVEKTINGNPETNIAKVTSQVTWTFQGKNEKVELNTYLYGLE
jgi:prepilin-type N-terminal cleavage/methylation domain-containing protein